MKVYKYVRGERAHEMEEELDMASYIISNKDRLALIDLLQVVTNVTITGVDTRVISDREWNIIATTQDKQGAVSTGCTIEEAVEGWFEQMEMPKPEAYLSIYELKAQEI